jgi:hypothetical protein
MSIPAVPYTTPSASVVPQRGDPTPAPGVPAAVTAAVQYTGPIYVYGFAWVDIQAALTDVGGAAITDVFFYPEWSLAATPGAGDWTPVYREEFNVAAAPTGDGLALESAYVAQIQVAPADLPRTVGITVRTRGLWMRFGFAGDAAVANVAAALSTLRRTV